MMDLFLIKKTIRMSRELLITIWLIFSVTAVSMAEVNFVSMGPPFTTHIDSNTLNGGDHGGTPTNAYDENFDTFYGSALDTEGDGNVTHIVIVEADFQIPVHLNRISYSMGGSAGGYGDDDNYWNYYMYIEYKIYDSWFELPDSRHQDSGGQSSGGYYTGIINHTYSPLPLDNVQALRATVYMHSFFTGGPSYYHAHAFIYELQGWGELPDTPTLTATPSPTPLPSTPTPTRTPTSPALVIIEDSIVWNVYCTSLVVEFDTNLPSIGSVCYYFGIGPPPPPPAADCINDPFVGTHHRVIVPSLGQDQDSVDGFYIWFQIHASAAGYSIWYPDDSYLWGQAMPCDDYDPPTYLVPPVCVASDNDSVWLTWTTNELSSPEIYYGVAPTTLTMYQEWTNEWSYWLNQLEGLWSGAWYNFGVISHDVHHNYAPMTDPEVGRFRTRDDEDDEAPYGQGLFFTWIDDGLVEVHVITNEFCAVATCWYGEYNPDYPDSCDRFGPYYSYNTDEHYFILPIQNPAIRYALKLQFTDMYDQTSILSGCLQIPLPEPTPVPESRNGSKARSAELLGGPAVVSLSKYEAVVWWETENRYSGRVEWWKDGETERWEADHAGLPPDGKRQEHFVILTHLKPNNIYHYQVSSNGVELGDEHGFTTPSELAGEPVITFGPVAYTQGSNELIFWETDSFCDNQVEYGLSANYSALQSRLQSGTEHLIILSGLTIGTQYHAAAVSHDIWMNEARSNDFSFVTQADTTPPQFTGELGLRPREDDRWEFFGETDKPAILEFSYGTEPNVLDVTRTYRDFRIHHRITLLQGQSLGTYYYSATLEGIGTEPSTENGSVVITYTPTFTQTATPTVTSTAPATATSTTPPTATPTSSPTVVVTTGVTLEMPAPLFHEGDECYLTATISSDEPEVLVTVPLVVTLDLNGLYWFYPSWRCEYSTNPAECYDFELITLKPGSEVKPILDFTWPAGAGSYSNARFYGAMLNQEMTALFGGMGQWEFGWEP